MHHTIYNYILFVTFFTNRRIFNVVIGILSLECIDILLILTALPIYIVKSSISFYLMQ